LRETQTILFANKYEPKHHRKEESVGKVLEKCPNFFFDAEKKIIKPSLYTSNGFGVWNWKSVEECEKVLGLACFSQSFHPGPFECRLYKSGTWHRTVAWHIDSDHVFYPEFPWDAALKKCIDSLGVDAVAVDVRTDGETLQIMEINGVFGVPYEWVITNTLRIDLIVWFFDRVFLGFCNFQLSWRRMWQDILSIYHVIRLKTKWVLGQDLRRGLLPSSKET